MKHLKDNSIHYIRKERRLSFLVSLMKRQKKTLTIEELKLSSAPLSAMRSQKSEQCTISHTSHNNC